MKFKMSFFVLLAVAFLGTTVQADPGTATGTFLKIGTSARAASMGGAFVGVADGGAFSLLTNPASAGHVDNIDLAFNYSDWFMDTSHNYFGGIKRVDDYAFGVNVFYFDAGEFEWREDPTRPTATPDGTFTSNEMAIGLTASRRFSPDLSMGLTGKYVYSKIADEEANGFAADFGLLYQPDFNNVTIGFSISNLGQKLTYIEEAYELPTIVRAGISYPVNHFATMAIDINKASDSDLRVQGGLELSFRDMLSVRGGYKLNYDTESFAAGTGIKLKHYRVDYAFVPYSDDLGDSHYFSFGLQF